MTAINAERGEVGLALDARVFPMLPTFAAANAIESQLGAVSNIVARLTVQRDIPKFGELAIIATECIKAAGKDRNDEMLVRVNAETIGEKIYEEGINDVLLKSFVVLLSNMVSGGTNSRARKKAEAAALAAAQQQTGSPTAD